MSPREGENITITAHRYGQADLRQLCTHIIGNAKVNKNTFKSRISAFSLFSFF